MASLFSSPSTPLHAASRRPSIPPPPSSPINFQTHLPLIDFPAKQKLLSPLLIGSKNTNEGGDERNEFYLNLGMAVRTLREDLPLIFSRDLNYDIYRGDITFSDPVNAFQGIDSYRMIFWALRFHGRMLFREISLEVLRIWQLSDDVILIRWNLKGVPRVPWETRGEFQGTSRYRLDRRGKIYDHRVDNLAVNFPKVKAPSSSAVVLNLMAPSPCPPVAMVDESGAVAAGCCSWVEYYRAVEETLYRGRRLADDELPLCIDTNELRFCSC